MRRAFKVKSKAFFLVSQVFSFRHTKRTSKNVTGTSFSYSYKKVLLRCFTASKISLQMNTTQLLKLKQIYLPGSKEGGLSRCLSTAQKFALKANLHCNYFVL